MVGSSPNPMFLFDKLTLHDLRHHFMPPELQKKKSIIVCDLNFDTDAWKEGAREAFVGLFRTCAEDYKDVKKLIAAAAFKTTLKSARSIQNIGRGV